MISKTILIGWTIFIGWAFLTGVANVTESGASEGMIGFAVLFSAVVHFVLWCAVAVPTYIISRMFKRPVAGASQ